MYVLTTFIIPFIVAFSVIRLIIPRLEEKGIIGKDMNKPGNPEVPEMGGWLCLS